QSREADFLLCSDEDSGMLVPDSALTIRSGTYGVFELVGDQLVFRSVTGKPVRDGMFFVSSGLSPGNPVMVNAANAEEKRVRLW
ncbi:MAG: efflux RND transporter periplasmic adaptor subunit, partial [Pyramidobacter sp.]|nr:efflux RND transporter periplasmic adaptor subunit [Pyramidobacter sp.]